jgi:hypothetical protein
MGLRGTNGTPLPPFSEGKIKFALESFALAWGSAPFLVAIFNRYLEGGVVTSCKEEVALLPALWLQIDLFACRTGTPRGSFKVHVLTLGLGFSTTKFEFCKRSVDLANTTRFTE